MNDDHSREDIIRYRIEKSEELLNEVALLIEHGFANAAVSRMYYACYHSISALLFSHNIETKTHRGLRQQFGNHFVKTGIIDIEKAKFFNDIADKRNKSDYDDFIAFDLEKAKEIFPQIKEMVKVVREHTII